MTRSAAEPRPTEALNKAKRDCLPMSRDYMVYGNEDFFLKQMKLPTAHYVLNPISAQMRIIAYCK